MGFIMLSNDGLFEICTVKTYTKGAIGLLEVSEKGYPLGQSGDWGNDSV